MLTFVGAAGPVRGERLDGEDGCKVIRHRKLDRSGKRSPAILSTPAVRLSSDLLIARGTANSRRIRLLK